MRREDWFVWVNMDKGTVAMNTITSLDAFWPGLLVCYFFTLKIIYNTTIYSVLNYCMYVSAKFISA